MKYQFEWDGEIQACYYCPMLDEAGENFYCKIMGTEIKCQKDKLSDCPLIKIEEETK